jgi:putative transposase
MCSVALTARTLSISYAKNVTEIEPHGLIGVDRNLNNVTIADLNEHVEQLDLSEATRIKAQCRETKRHLKRNDVRICKQVYGKYGRIQRNRVQQILHHASKVIVAQAKRNQYGIVMEKLTDIRKLYRKGNWQGKKYRARMNDWSYYELQRQIEYKARWEGLPVIYVNPSGTSVKCSACGSRMARVPKKNRKLKCQSCGVTVDRDVNAARNILARGMRLMPVASANEAMVSVFQPPVDADEFDYRLITR